MSAAGLGHNRGPSMEPGHAWRTHCWSEARRALLPHLPLEVIRLRVRRAAELGLDYRTYATVRATSGCDIVAFLFSTNALQLMRAEDRLPEDRARKLAATHGCGRALLAHPPHDPARLTAAIETAHAIRFDGAARAPHFAAAWSEVRGAVLAALTPAGLPPQGVVMVGDTGFEREWSMAGRLAGYLPAERYFGAAAG